MKSRELPNTRQRPLFVKEKAQKRSDKLGHREADFSNPDPAEIFIGDTLLADYLESVEMGWVKGLRRAGLAEHAVEQIGRRADKRKKEGKDPATLKTSMTEPEAVVQPLKNGTLRPAYKPSVLTNGAQLIIGKYLSPANEIVAVRPMLEGYKSLVGTWPARLMADAGYHNYQLLGLEPGGKNTAGINVGTAQHARCEQAVRLTSEVVP